jgi:hypothetical protein
VGILPYTLGIFNMWLSPSGYELAIQSLFYVMNILIVLFMPVVLFFGSSIFKEHWEEVYLKLIPAYFVFLITFIAIWPITKRFENQVRLERFHQVITDLQPISEAIHKYEDQNGRPPKSLASLSVPNELLGLELSYEYITGEPAKEKYQNTWAIHITAPVEFFDYAHYLYLPEQNYPAPYSEFDGWGFFKD